MKKILYTYIIYIGVAMMFASCSDLDESERFKYVKPASVACSVLIEDYTGQLCVNCPQSVDVIKQIHEVYGDNAIAVAIHGGHLALSSNVSDMGLSTDDSEAYYAAVGAPAQPSGRVNRKGIPVNIYQWQSLVKAEIEKAAPVSLKLKADYDATSHKVFVTVDAGGVDGNVNGKLQIWIVEDNIVAPQIMPDGSTKMDYIHNSVLRAAVNGTWGEDFKINEGETKTVNSSAVLKQNWKPEDCSIVAFVYDNSGVLQTAKTKIKN